MNTPIAPQPGLHDMTFEQFQQRYGPWKSLTPAEVAALLDGAAFPWWIAGGWALDAASGVPRFHEDVDLVVLRRDLPAFCEFFAGKHLWTPYRQALEPLWPGMDAPEDREQVWVRDDAYSPWLLDVLLTPSDGDRMLFKRDHGINWAIEDAAYVVDGVPYLAPEYALLYKARLGRDKDEEDFANVLPKLDAKARAWLAAALDRHLPGHAWRARL